MVLHVERARTGTVRTAVETVRVRRRIVTETVQVPVTVRREVLEVTRSAVDASPAPEVAEGAGGPGGDRTVEVVLREEVPVVTTATRAYERVRVEVVEVTGSQEVATRLRREQVEVTGPGAD